MILGRGLSMLANPRQLSSSSSSTIVPLLGELHLGVVPLERNLKMEVGCAPKSGYVWKCFESFVHVVWSIESLVYYSDDNLNMIC